MILVVVGALFHLFTLRPGVSWGDSAQYLHHAKNLALGLPYGETGYVYNRHWPSVGPPAYPPGFPMLLVPFYWNFELSFVPYKILGVVFLVALSAMSPLWDRDPSSSTGFAVAALLLFNPYFFGFQQSVLSDLPFAFFWAATIFWYRAISQPRARAWHILVLAGFIAVAAAIRTPGILLLPAVLVHNIIVNRRLSALVITVSVVVCTLVALSRFLVGGSDTFYVDQFTGYDWTIPLLNIRYFASDLNAEFWPAIPCVPYSHRAIFLLVNISALVGAAAALRDRLTVADYASALYVLLILIWPSYQGVRFLIPLLPLYLYFAVSGWRVIVFRLVPRRFETLARFVAAGVICATFVPGLASAVQARDTPMPEGPHVLSAQQLFAHARASSATDAVFLFNWPRSLALFGERRASLFPYGKDDAVISAYLTEVGATHVVIDLEDDADRKYASPFVQRNQRRFREVFRNDRYVVYELQQEDLRKQRRVRDEKSGRGPSQSAYITKRDAILARQW